MDALKRLMSWGNWKSPHGLAWHMVNIAGELVIGCWGLWAVVDFVQVVRADGSTLPSYPNLCFRLLLAAVCFYVMYREIRIVRDLRNKEKKE